MTFSFGNLAFRIGFGRTVKVDSKTGRRRKVTSAFVKTEVPYGGLATTGPQTVKVTVDSGVAIHNPSPLDKGGDQYRLEAGRQWALKALIVKLGESGHSTEFVEAVVRAYFLRPGATAPLDYVWCKVLNLPPDIVEKFKTADAATDATLPTAA